MKSKSVIAFFALLLMSVIWGLGYIGVSNGLNNGWGPFPILFVRSIIGGLVILPFTIKKSYKSKKLFKQGLIVGLVTFLAYAFQTFGQDRTTISATSFITSLYVIFVPILLRIIIKRKEKPIIYIACAISMIGCFLINIKFPLSFDTENLLGNVLVFIGMIFFALQIFFIGRFSVETDILQLTVIELFVMGFLSLVALSITNDFSFHKEGLLGLIAVGVFSSGLCGVIQMFGQKYLNDSICGIIMSLESLFGTLFAFIFYKEVLSWIQWIGCALIFSPVLICQIAIVKYKRQGIDLADL